MLVLEAFNYRRHNVDCASFSLLWISYLDFVRSCQKEVNRRTDQLDRRNSWISRFQTLLRRSHHSREAADETCAETFRPRSHSHHPPLWHITWLLRWSQSDPLMTGMSGVRRLDQSVLRSQSVWLKCDDREMSEYPFKLHQHSEQTEPRTTRDFSKSLET